MVEPMCNTFKFTKHTAVWPVQQIFTHHYSTIRFTFIFVLSSHLSVEHLYHTLLVITVLNLHERIHPIRFHA